MQIYTIVMAQESNIYNDWMEKFSDVFENMEIRTISENCGRGLVSKKTFKAGDVIFRDKPLCAMQHVYSKRTCISCVNCFRIVGNIRQQLTRVLKNQQQNLSMFPEANDLLSEDVLHNEYLTQPEPIPCPHGCGAVFCSLECQSEALENSYHRILCAELDIEQRKKFQAFVSHARRYHENFILAAIAYGDIICKVKYHDLSIDDAMKEYSAFFGKPWFELVQLPNVHTEDSRVLQFKELRLKRCTESLALLTEMLFDTCVLESTEEVFRKNKELQQNTDKILNEETCYETGILPKSVEDEAEKEASKWGKLFNLDFYSHLLGEFDLVNMSIEFASPFDSIFGAVRKNKQTASLEVQRKDGSVTTLGHIYRTLNSGKHSVLKEINRISKCVEDLECMNEEMNYPYNENDSDASSSSSSSSDNDDDDDDNHEDKKEETEVMPGFLGLGMYRSIAMTNHSCYPNCEVDFVDSSTCVVKATRPIAIEEELTISYVEESDILVDRQRHLRRDYLFVCSCVKCKVEAGRAILKNQMPLSASTTLPASKRKLCDQDNDIEYATKISAIINVEVNVVIELLAVLEKDAKDREENLESCDLVANERDNDENDEKINKDDRLEEFDVTIPKFDLNRDVNLKESLSTNEEKSILKNTPPKDSTLSVDSPHGLQSILPDLSIYNRCSVDKEKFESPIFTHSQFSDQEEESNVDDDESESFEFEAMPASKILPNGGVDITSRKALMKTKQVVSLCPTKKRILEDDEEENIEKHTDLLPSNSPRVSHLSMSTVIPTKNESINNENNKDLLKLEINVNSRKFMTQKLTLAAATPSDISVDRTSLHSSVAPTNCTNAVRLPFLPLLPDEGVGSLANATANSDLMNDNGVQNDRSELQFADGITTQRSRVASRLPSAASTTRAGMNYGASNSLVNILGTPGSFERRLTLGLLDENNFATYSHIDADSTTIGQGTNPSSGVASRLHSGISSIVRLRSACRSAISDGRFNGISMDSHERLTNLKLEIECESGDEEDILASAGPLHSTRPEVPPRVANNSQIEEDDLDVSLGVSKSNRKQLLMSNKPVASSSVSNCFNKDGVSGVTLANLSILVPPRIPSAKTSIKNKILRTTTASTNVHDNSDAISVAISSCDSATSSSSRSIISAKQPQQKQQITRTINPSSMKMSSRKTPLKPLSAPLKVTLPSVNTTTSSSVFLSLSKRLESNADSNCIPSMLNPNLTRSKAAPPPRKEVVSAAASKNKEELKRMENAKLLSLKMAGLVMDSKQDLDEDEKEIMNERVTPSVRSLLLSQAASRSSRIQPLNTSTSKNHKDIANDFQGLAQRSAIATSESEVSEESESESESEDYDDDEEDEEEEENEDKNDSHLTTSNLEFYSSSMLRGWAEKKKNNLFNVDLKELPLNITPSLEKKTNNLLDEALNEKALISALYSEKQRRAAVEKELSSGISANVSKLSEVVQAALLLDDGLD